VELTGWVFTLAGGYTVVRTERAMLDVVFGVRYLQLDTDLEFDIDNMKGTSRRTTRAARRSLISISTVLMPG
jgi:hypothetical protein